MIDFIRINYKDVLGAKTFIEDDKNFDKISTRVNARSGEIEEVYKTNLKSMDITIGQKNISVKNSIHKLYNVMIDDLNHNYNDFSFSKLCKTIDYVTSKLKGIENGYITQLEFGLNITTPVPASNILNENLLMHKYKCFNSNNKFKGKGEYREFKHENYSIKIYDKAKQYKQARNILRVEVKFTRRKEFNQLGIWTIEDLKSKSNLMILFRYLITRFDELTILDSIDDINLINEKDKNQLLNYSSYLFWQKLFGSDKRYHKRKHIDRFNDLIRKYNLDIRKRYIRNSLIQKFKELLNR